MNQHLKQAIAAARAGKKPQAKVLLARVIKDEPDNANAWFLLSSLADTEEQKIQHLEKVLELQPGHPLAAEHLAELAPPPPEPEPVEETATEPEYDEMGDTLIMPPLASEPAESEVEEPEPEAADISDVPDDPEEAMAWLERLAADQGARLEELPTISEEMALSEETAEAEPPAPVEPIVMEEAEPELETADTFDFSDEDDDAMAWLDEMAADQGTSFDELPTMTDEEAAADTLMDLDDDFSWQDEDVDEEPEEEGAPGRTLTISEDLDFVQQAEADSIPVWLAEDEELLTADTVITDSPAEETPEPEPENLPDWLADESLEGWEGDEGEKSGQIIWKPGEGDDSKKPTPPAAKKQAEPAKKETAAPTDNSGLYIALLAIVAIIAFAAILYLLFTQIL